SAVTFSIHCSVETGEKSEKSFSFLSAIVYLKLKQELILSLFLSVSFQMSVVRLANIINKFKQNFFL
ncbi:hypothetical protein, partial [Bacteroides congonensis]|uniref:hypothetical protein n=1 Tax=Bacteroides congonensis TaxID=1871006 RepID=UPI00272C08E0